MVVSEIMTTVAAATPEFTIVKIIKWRWHRRGGRLAAALILNHDVFAGFTER